MIMFDKYDYRLPSDWASPIVNDDTSGMTDEEEQEFLKFKRDLCGKYGGHQLLLKDMEQEPYFARSSDVSSLGGNMLDFVVLVKKKNIEITVEGNFSYEDKTAFTRSAMVGQYDGVSNDDDVFYWFDDMDKVLGDHPDFTITEFRINGFVFDNADELAAQLKGGKIFTNSSLDDGQYLFYDNELLNPYRVGNYEEGDMAVNDSWDECDGATSWSEIRSL